MTEVIIRQSGHAGHITLNRPKALNALTWDMLLAIEQALDSWRDNNAIALIIVDGAGDRAFCSGGDLAEMYASGQRGDYDYGRRFWRDEYRLNAKLFNYPKPIVTFLHGFTMGGGVGVGCHASHRIVCADSQIAMPECTIGLVPDVGGSLILARAPGHCGEYLGLTGDRMDAGDAIYAGFADHFIPQENWADLKAELMANGAAKAVTDARTTEPTARLAAWQDEIDLSFGADMLTDIGDNLEKATGPVSAQALKLMHRNAPLAMATAIQIIRAARTDDGIEHALDREFRFTYRCVAQGDFIEGIRAAIIDRDRAPKWQHQSWDCVQDTQVAQMTSSLGKDALEWKDTT